MDSFAEAWDVICEYCKSNITDVAYNTWFKKLIPVGLDFSEGVALIEAPNDFHRNTIEKFYTELLTTAFSSIFGDTIKYKILTHDELPSVAKEEEEKEKEKAPALPKAEELTFDNFIVGSSNKFAHAACKAVAASPASVYNPLFIWGNSGLGKTHLLSAIRAELEKNSPGIRVISINGEKFTNELINAIQAGTSAAFKEKYRQADVLLVDDIQFIAGKESTQEEFFYTFNHLYENNKQIVLVSDRPPKEIQRLEDRLKSRFQQGLTADIQPPDFETRLAIIKKKAEMLNIEIPNNVCDFIAGKLKSNIRQLEGAVKKIKAMNYLQGRTVTISAANSAIADILNDDQPEQLTPEKIIDEVARTYGVSSEDIKSEKRMQKISQARQVAMYVMRETKQSSMAAIGDAFGGRDHSTVVYAISEVEKRIKKDPNVKATVEDIVKNLKGR
ncbi:MAG: chromosomal replication initiator protein DnaA [Clostridia bacterium]|nr:chromosomal replication initiator protein DnaA [Clostridia bacterium]